MTNPLHALSDDELFLNASRAIQQAAQGEADGGDEASYDIAMAMMEESDRRLVASGHQARCRSGIYTQAYEAVTALRAGVQPASVACNCRASAGEAPKRA